MRWPSASTVSTTNLPSPSWEITTRPASSSGMVNAATFEPVPVRLMSSNAGLGGLAWTASDGAGVGVTGGALAALAAADAAGLRFVGGRVPGEVPAPTSQPATRKIVHRISKRRVIAQL